MASKTISFRIFLNDQLVDTRSFSQEVIKLGRLSSSHLRLEGEAVGRMHAVIEVGATGDVRLIDLGSSSGTLLNGDMIDRSHELSSGDKLELGPYRLELTIADSVAAPVHHEPTAAVASAPVMAAPAPQANVSIDLSKVEDSSEEVAEVITTYGRSILDVAHVGQTRSRRRTVLPLMAFGGVLMVGGLGLFGYEVSQPWEQHNAAVAEAQQRHAEAPPAPGLGTGSLGLMLALLGVVPFLGGALRRRDVGLDAFTIGEGSEANFKVSGDGLQDPAASALISRMNGGYALSFTPAMRGSVELGEHQLSLADLVATGRAHASDGAYHYALPSGARAKVEHGDIRFNVNLVKRGAIVAGRGEVDWPFWGYFGGTATLATAFYLLMRSMPDDALAMQMADDEAAARFASYFHQADEEQQAEPIEMDSDVPDDEAQSGESGKRAAGPEGKMGNPKEKSSQGAYAMKGPKHAVPQITRHFDPNQSARTAGILGILASTDKHFLASVDGGAFAVGNDDADIWGNLVGVDQAASYGNAGLGLVGVGRQGGGTAGGLIGMSNTGLLGHGNGTGGLYHGNQGGNGGVIGFGDRKEKVPVPRVGKGEVTGSGIDRDMIRRIVRAHLNEVRSCYNAGLLKNPNLQGRVTIQFSIMGTGKVGSSVVQEDTAKDGSVANCIAKAVKRWQFPRVVGGGTALVSYPFLLQSR
ncbi:AgmX/PglI C-terminal domain-containing protein [Enhygromyxa salina]|uniref:FHA domain protein n=1 Tax=Enhygromyxa salina TaxID=215803 RepID=A0A2S9YQ54_9BACT|nr:AgmX/PglI C-terminal domain-containing protein [Enhygromyxa salina]PRQ07202.1 FHA domain protein [Enhygromyxa salina]